MKPWEHLELRNNKWKIKGRRLNVVDLVLGMNARKETPEETCQTFMISHEELDEAILFLEQHPEEIARHQSLYEAFLKPKSP